MTVKHSIREGLVLTPSPARKRSKRILIVGDGKVARSLASSFAYQKIPTLVWRRSQRVTLDELLCMELFTYVFLAIPERSLALHAKVFAQSKQRYVTVSGSVSEADLAGMGLPSVEVFHPLMTFAQPESLKGVPIAVSSPGLRRLAKQCGAAPFAIATDRSLYHAAAVTSAAGVVTTMLLAMELLQASGVSDVAVLGPIAHRAIDNVLQQGAGAMTGPVVRGDNATVKAHEKAMRGRATPSSQRLYKALLASMRQRVSQATRGEQS